MSTLNNFPNAFYIILPFLFSLVSFLLLLNIAIWIFDETKSKESIRKSFTVLKFGSLGLLVIAIIVFIIQLL